MIKKFIRKILGVKDERDPTQPLILGPAEHGIDPKLVSGNAVRLTQTLQEAGFQAFVVGGAVRDLLLGVKPKDFDIATDATPEEVKKLFRPQDFGFAVIGGILDAQELADEFLNH